MAYQRKPLTARQCEECGDPYEAVDRRRRYCCPGCKTAASQARRPATAGRSQRPPADYASGTSLAPLATPPGPEASTESALAAPPTGPPSPSFGKLVLTNAAGNLLTDAVKSFWTPKAAAGRAPASGWPTWPPAELLAATGPPVLLTDPSWLAPQLLTPVTYHRHQLYLCVEEGLTVVLHHVGPGRWRYVRTPAQLAQLAAPPPRCPRHPNAASQVWAGFGVTPQRASGAPLVAERYAGVGTQATRP